MQGTEACSCSVFLRNCTYLPPVRERRQQVCSLLAAELSWDVKNCAKWSCQEIFIFRREVDIVLAFCQFLRFPSFGRWKVCSFFSMSKDFPSSWTNITLYIQTQLGRKKKKKSNTGRTKRLSNFPKMTQMQNSCYPPSSVWEPQQKKKCHALFITICCRNDWYFHTV